ncbi:transglycosylase domain-containing protein [Henriciella sp.]|uniref:transglycosylase domain-containing protein n=1 Tax=Henriciella sp. TaxID=1968823 RepID=UPI002603013C|nr:transglycosylase domain-containing protein [Henriciella sp.]
MTRWISYVTMCLIGLSVLALFGAYCLFSSLAATAIHDSGFTAESELSQSSDAFRIVNQSLGPKEAGMDGPHPVADRLALEIHSEQATAGIGAHLTRLFIARQLKQRFDTSELTAEWLEHVYVGSGQYGVETVSHDEFDKPFDELTNKEAMLIAALIKNPTIRTSPDRWKKEATRLREVYAPNRRDF